HAPTEMINIIMGTIILFTAIPLMFRIIKSRFKSKGGK
ncbi:MAG: ABC transporter permease, partial [Finegoldia magna]|nr:ABC transporter permease [Finegoldia magna]